ncbi:MAG: DUF2283 domain-containing protein [Candidatus Woesearchaeota archaeon]
MDGLIMESWYDKEEDILNIQLHDKEYWKSIELKDITIDISKDGTITGIEILHASHVFSGETKKVLESTKQASSTA